MPLCQYNAVWKLIQLILISFAGLFKLLTSVGLPCHMLSQMSGHEQHKNWGMSTLIALYVKLAFDLIISQ